LVNETRFVFFDFCYDFDFSFQMQTSSLILSLFIFIGGRLKVLLNYGFFFCFFVMLNQLSSIENVFDLTNLFALEMDS
jgi:hypothetical protein